MKIVKRIVAAVVVSAMALSLAACGGSKAKKISAEDFQAKLEKENFTVMETPSSDEQITKTLVGYNEDMSVMVTYSLYGNKDDAKKAFEDFKEGAEEAKKSGEIEKLRSIVTANGRSYSDPIVDSDGEIDMDASRRVEIKFRLKEEEMVDQMMEILNAE